MNWYAYVGNDPVNMNDPTGMCPWYIGALVGGIAEAASQAIAGKGFDDKIVASMVNNPTNSLTRHLT